MRVGKHGWRGIERLPAIHLRQARILVLAGAMAGLLAGEKPACAQQAVDGRELQFDIPSQPLASALKAYRATTGIDLFYESTVMEGLRAPTLQGTFTPEAALPRLLEGTGLSVAWFESGTGTILPLRSREGSGRELAAIKTKTAEFAPYLAFLQEGVRSALCRSPATQVDTSELIIRLWIAASGAVARAELSTSTGPDERLQAYAAALRTLVIGAPPPQGMPQPVTLMVLPRASRKVAECAPLDAPGSAHD